MVRATYKPAPKTTAEAPKRRRRIVTEPVAILGAYEQLDVKPEDEEQVDVMVPKGFILTDDAHVMHPYKAGPQKMPRSHAEHPYSGLNGVTIAD